MIGTPIAFGLTMIVCFTLFYYYWRIRQLRARLLSAQMAPVQELDYPAEFGIGKNVVETFPTIKACELKCTASEDLQCPICLVEYEEWEVLRQLPFCGHIFHTLCVGAWFEKQTTCPVCRMSMSELTESFGESLVAESIRMQCRRNSIPPADVTVEVGMVVNRRLSMSTTPPAPAATTELGTEETEPKSEVDVQVICEEPADFHVVNVPPQAQTCSKCKAATKTEMQQQSEPKTGESTEEASSQEISGMHIIPDGSCDAPGLTSANVQEDVRITVMLQPVLSQSSAGVNGSRC